MVGDRSSGEAVHAVVYPLEDRRRDQTLQRRPRDTGTLCLLAGQQPPLILGDDGEPSNCRRTGILTAAFYRTGILTAAFYLIYEAIPLVEGSK